MNGGAASAPVAVTFDPVGADVAPLVPRWWVVTLRLTDEARDVRACLHVRANDWKEAHEKAQRIVSSASVSRIDEATTATGEKT